MTRAPRHWTHRSPVTREPALAGAPAPARRRRSWLATKPQWILAALLLVVVGIDTYRIAFFADDLHFIDVARRHALLDVLRGQSGIWPWYRPLSRELFFALVTAFGPGASVIAHTLSIGCLLASCLLLARIGAALFGAEIGWMAAALFLTNGFTKFVTAWPSGFQDLLAVSLTLGAVAAQQRGRHAVTLLLAGLAPLAKETGFLVFPLLAVHRGWFGERQGRVAWVARLGAVCLVDIALHVAARMTWPAHGPSPVVAVPASYTWNVLGQVAAGFVAEPPTVESGPFLAAVAGFALTWVLLGLGKERRGPDPHAAAAPPPAARTVGFVAVAAALGLMPLIVGHVARITVAHAYHSFPATPWIALLAARALLAWPAPVRRGAVALLVAWNAAGLAYRPANLSVPDGWSFRRWDWPEAVRLTSVARRLESDLRRELAQRPESLVVLYRKMPTGCLFQTEDGPATREALRDPTVKAYWINDPADDVRGDRLVVLDFSTDDFHLHRRTWSSDEVLRQAMNAVMAQRPATARALASYGESADPRAFDRAYLRAAAALLARGPLAFVHALRDGGVDDTLGTAPAAVAEPLSGVSPNLGRALETVLRHPLTAASHAALADTLIRHGARQRAGFELRLAVRLDPTRFEDRYRLATLMAEMGGDLEALDELRALAADPHAGAQRDRARRMIAEMETSPTHR